MPTLDLMPEKAREMLAMVERKVDTLSRLTDNDRYNLYDHAAELRRGGVRV